MQLLVFGLSITSSWGNGHATTYRSLFPALARRGHRIVFYERDVEYYALRRDLENPWYAEVRIYQSWKAIRQRAIAEAAAADVVMTTSFCPDGSAIQCDILGLDHPLKVFYDLDTPVTLDGLDLDSPAIAAYIRREHVPLFDLYLSFTGGPVLQSLTTRYGARRVAPLYLCIDPEEYRSREISRVFDLTFVGTYAADRQAKLEELFLAPARALPDRRFLLAGPMYPQDLTLPANVERRSHVPGAELPAFYSASEFTLNLTRRPMQRAGFSPQGRLFEAACCETPVLTDDWPGLTEFFEPGSELLVVGSTEDVCRALTETTPAERRRLAARARERVAAAHSGERRAQQLEKEIEAAACRVACPA
jgi:spore maturation protein CgeB